MERKLYVSWQSVESRKWYTIGELTYQSEAGYVFRYVEDVNRARLEEGFSLLSAFPEMDRAYVSKRLFSFFANRIIAPARPTYNDVIKRVGLQPVGDPTSPDYIFDYLSRTRGWRATDSFEVYSPVEKLDAVDVYQWKFFTRGLRYAHGDIQEAWLKETPELPLRMCLDLHNAYDPCAVFVVDKKGTFMGFVPGDYSQIIHEIVSKAIPNGIELEILRHNKAEKLHQKRFLLKMRATMPAGFILDQPSGLNPVVDFDVSVA